MTATFARLTTNPANSEAVAWLSPMTYKRDGTKRPVVLFHGKGGTELEAFDAGAGAWYKAADAIATAGYPVVCPRAGGPITWNVSTTLAGQAVTFAQGSEVGGKSGKVFVAGTSGGFLPACKWARANPSLVAGIIGLVPATDLAFVFNAYPSSQAEIDTAFGGHSAYLAALPTNNPQQYAAADLAGIPWLIIRSTDDQPELGMPGMQSTFVTTVQGSSPGKVTEVTMTGGHSLANLPYEPIKTFLDAYA